MTATMTRPTTGLFAASQARSIGFTGTLKGMTVAQHSAVWATMMRLRDDGAAEFHHGDAIGADAEAHDIATALALMTVGHPCDLEDARAFKVCDRTEPVMRPLDRNRRIVEASNVLIAAPRTTGEMRRSGTWATIRYARKAGIRRILVTPLGTVVEESP